MSGWRNDATWGVCELCHMADRRWRVLTHQTRTGHWTCKACARLDAA